MHNKDDSFILDYSDEPITHYHKPNSKQRARRRRERGEVEGTNPLISTDVASSEVLQQQKKKKKHSPRQNKKKKNIVNSLEEFVETPVDEETYEMGIIGSYADLETGSVAQSSE